MVAYPNQQSLYRGMNPVSMRSSQGSAATGRYVSGQGATKVISPYGYQPSQIQGGDMGTPSAPAKSEPAKTTATPASMDDSLVQTPVGEKLRLVDPVIDQAVEDTVVGTGKQLGMNAGVPLGAGALAGLSFGKMLPYVLEASLDALPQTAALNLGYMAVDQGLPSAYAALADMADENSYSGEKVGAARDAYGHLNAANLSDDVAGAAARGLGDRMERSQSLTSRFTGMVGNVLGPIGSWMDENIAQPAMNAIGLADEAQPEGLDKAALGEEANNPDFATSDYDRDMMKSEEIELQEMAARERATKDKERQDSIQAMSALARDKAMGRPSGWNNGGWGMAGFSDHHGGLDRGGADRGTVGGYGGLNPGEEEGSNPGGFGSGSGGSAGEGFGQGW